MEKAQLRSRSRAHTERNTRVRKATRGMSGCVEGGKPVSWREGKWRGWGEVRRARIPLWILKSVNKVLMILKGCGGHLVL